MKKFLTKQEAWLKIGAAFAKAKHSEWRKKHKLGLQVQIIKGHLVLGLCSCIRVLYKDDRITTRDCEDMLGAVEKRVWKMELGEGCYLYPLTESGAKRRAAFCRGQARKCK